MRRQANRWALEEGSPESRTSRMLRMSECLKAVVRSPWVGGRTFGGVWTRARLEEDGPTTWETLASPHDQSSATGDPVTTLRPARVCSRMCRRAKKKRLHGVGRGRGEPEPRLKEARESGDCIGARTVGTGGNRTHSSKGGPCWERTSGGIHARRLDAGAHVTSEARAADQPSL